MAESPPARAEPQDPGAALMQMIGGSRVSQVVHVAAQLGIADHLKSGPCHVSVLAERVQAHSPSLLRLMRALVSLGVFAEAAANDDDAQGPTFKLTPLSERLLSDDPNSLRHAAIYNGIPEVYQSWGHLLHSVKTGECAFEFLHGKDMFAHMARDKASAEAYNGAMTNFSAADADVILAAYPDFSDMTSLLDVGGGAGHLMSRILKKHSCIMKGVILELPAVGPEARALLAGAGLAARSSVVDGSFLEAFPVQECLSGACMLKNIILNWDDEKASTILKNCHAALNEKGKVLVIEPVLGEPNEVSAVPLVDVNMLLVCPGGKLRTEAEHRALFAASGFTLSRILKTESTLRIIEGKKM